MNACNLINECKKSTKTCTYLCYRYSCNSSNLYQRTIVPSPQEALAQELGIGGVLVFTARPNMPLHATQAQVLQCTP